MLYKILTINNCRAMSLDKTKLSLYSFLKRHKNLVNNAALNIKPNYFDKDLYSGHSYRGYDDADRDFICTKIKDLDLIFNGNNHRIQFDGIDFNTEKKAVIELMAVKKCIEKVLIELNAIELKNRDRDYSEYPLKICYTTFKEIDDDLQVILSSEEMSSFLHDIDLRTLEYENLKLEFGILWQTKLFRYSLHFLAFVPFLTSCLYVVFNADDTDFPFNERLVIIVSGCLMTILLHVFLNTKNSFKESFKFIAPKSRKNLREKNWLLFLNEDH
jgi:hypothetical protein